MEMQDNKKMSDLYTQWQASGLSVAAFCRQENISVSTFGYWIKKFRRQSALAGGGFSRIEVSQPASDARQPLACVGFPSGITIELYSPVSADFLKQLIC